MRTADGYKRVAETFNKVGEASKKAGIQFAYHNHYWEFIPDAQLGGKFPYDFLLESTDASNVKMEMDLCWISVAGQDPVAYFKKYPGRFPLVHVKDMKKLPNVKREQLASLNMAGGEKGVSAVGGGLIEWKRMYTGGDHGRGPGGLWGEGHPETAFASTSWRD